MIKLRFIFSSYLIFASIGYVCHSALALEMAQSIRSSGLGTEIIAPESQTPLESIKSPIKVGAQLRLRPELRNNTDYGGPRNYTLLRFRLNAEFKASPDTLIFFQPQFSKFFGEPTYLGTSTSQNKYQDTSGVFFDTSMIVHQAYLEYRLFRDFQIKGGRQILSYGDEVLIGAALGWANIGRSFDAIKFIYKNSDSFQSDLFWSRLVDTSTFARSGTGSADFGGFYNSFNFGNYLKNFDLYVLYLADTRLPTSLSLWTWGLRLKSTVVQVDYRIETDYQQGTTLNSLQTGNQTDLEVGYLIDSSKTLRVGAEGFIASPNFNQLFPAAHKWLGFADVLGRRNIMGVGFKSSISPITRWTLTCDSYLFYRASTDSPSYMFNGITALGSAQASTASFIGSELDVNLGFQVSSALNLSAGVNTLFSSDYLVQNFGSINPTYIFLELEARY